MSRIEPSASTTVSASTQRRALPYLNVAGAGGVGGDRAADEGAVEGRHRRIVEAVRRERALQFGQRDAGADAHAVPSGDA